MSPVGAGRQNILLIIADDLSYCHYGFMGTEPPGSFRLGDLTCRSRDPNADASTPNGAFPFNRSEADSTTAFPQTPFLDALAQRASVFTRAQVAGVACAPSRRTLMLAKHQRHLHYLFAGNGDGAMQCNIELKGCSSNADCTLPGDFCTDVRTLPEVLSDLTGQDYQSFGIGKVEFVSNNTGFTELDDLNSAKPPFGKFQCLDGCPAGAGCCATCQQCEADLAAHPPIVPVEARASVADVFSFIERRTILAGRSGSSILTHPFFIWYGPNIPHDGNNPEPFFLSLYPNLQPAIQQHFARISWLDVGIQAVLQYLQGSCVCGQDATGAPVKQALFDRTVVIVLADQGYLLPNAKGQPTENNLRQVLIISDPRQRPPSSTLAPHVFSDDLVHISDLMPTILDYAGVPPGRWPVYAFARDLKPLIEDPSRAPIRDIQFGEPGSQNITVSVQSHFAINRALMVGVCANAVDPGFGYNHHRPCVRDADCDAGGRLEGPCISPGDPAAQRCVNRPDVRCATDAACAVGLCTSGRCRHDPSLGSYKSFDGSACFADAQCAPPGVCRPIMLKAVATPLGTVASLYDINFDPDEANDLLELDPGYLGPCLRSEFEQCLFQFRQGGAPWVPFIPPPSCHPLALCGPLAWCGPANTTCP